MLPQGLWKESEPRFGFPVFKDCVNRVSQAVRLDFCSFNWKRAVKTALAQARQRRLPDLRMLLPLLAGRCPEMKIRGAFTTRQGEFIKDFGVLGAWSAGQAFDPPVQYSSASQKSDSPRQRTVGG
jgi:hypothetical protein